MSKSHQPRRSAAWLLGLCLIAAAVASVHLVGVQGARLAADHTDSPAANALDGLRERAEAGDGQATISLASSLITRYEQSKQRDDLYEASLWVDRAFYSDAVPRTQLIDRLYGRYCGDKVMQWHWMCHTAE